MVFTRHFIPNKEIENVKLTPLGGLLEQVPLGGSGRGRLVGAGRPQSPDPFSLPEATQLPLLRGLADEGRDGDAVIGDGGGRVASHWAPSSAASGEGVLDLGIGVTALQRMA